MTTETSKDCFGKFWEEKNPECVGGPDPMYTHPFTGSKVRDRCDFYEQCGRAHNANEAQKKLQSLIPTANLIRPQPTYQVPAAPMPQPSRVQQMFQTPQKPTFQPLQQYAQQPQPAPLAAPQQFYPAVYHPVQTLQPYETPSFLSILEPADQNTPLWRRVLTEALRAACKGSLQHGTFLIDHLPMYRTRK